MDILIVVFISFIVPILTIFLVVRSWSKKFKIPFPISKKHKWKVDKIRINGRDPYPSVIKCIKCGVRLHGKYNYEPLPFFNKQARFYKIIPGDPITNPCEKNEIFPT